MVVAVPHHCAQRQGAELQGVEGKARRTGDVKTITMDGRHHGTNPLLWWNDFSIFWRNDFVLLLRDHGALGACL